MTSTTILSIFLVLRFLQHLTERWLARINNRFSQNVSRLKDASEKLSISEDNLKKTVSYTKDRYLLSTWSSWISTLITLGFIATGGLGLIEHIANSISESQLIQGILFFILIGILSYVLELPFSWISTFKLEEKHGFNRQSQKDFWLDQLKSIILGTCLGIPFLAGLLWIMEKTGDQWWLLAWLFIFGFNLLTTWIYPSLLAPLFNKFTPLEEGELKSQLDSLARRVDFQTDGISIMDASKRSSHGNAYFTGVFGKKKIVLFDTLVQKMSTDEIVAVLAHELGHFKLKHIRWALIRSFFTMGIIFFLMSLLTNYPGLYQAFSFKSLTPHTTLIVFFMWFGLIGFLIQPFASLLSRKNEFAADAFALKHIDDKNTLGIALLKLRENNHSMPISHPIFSAFYHSHPPLLERLAAMNFEKA